MTRKTAAAAAIALAAALAAGAYLWKSRHAGHEGHGAAAVGTLHQCPMHPQVVREGPGSCPICGMPLVPVEREETPPSQGGRAQISVPVARQQLIGVRTDEARRRDLAHVIRASGRVAHDPELYAAIAEYIQAAKSLESMGAGASPESKRLMESLVSSAQTKLRMLGLGDEQIGRLSSAGAPPKHLILTHGQGRVWVYAEVYQQEIALIKPGLRLEARLNSLPGRVFAGKVMSVDPMVDPMTRTARVRAEVDNPDGVLKSDMYLDVQITVPLGRRLSVPRGAILDTGERQVAFVVKEDETFEPREVRTRAAGEENVEVLSGLEEGERVVSSANFLIDSESRLRSALEDFQGGREGRR